jgi:hypothetical protein
MVATPGFTPHVASLATAALISSRTCSAIALPSMI